MKVSNTSERLKELMNKHGYRQVDILEKCKPYCEKYNIKLGRNDLSQYVSGRVEPKQDKLTVLALALNVSEAWLMGFDVPLEENKWAHIKKAFDEMDAFDAELASLGWKCELISCNAWEEVEMGVHEGTPVGCTLPNGVRKDCKSCYMKQPKYVFSNGTTSFEVSTEDYSTFLKDSKAFFMKRIQKLMLKSSDKLFNNTLTNAAHADDYVNAPEELKKQEEDMIDKAMRPD